METRKNPAVTLKEKYGENYFRELGKKGGAAKVPKGFAANPTLARIAGGKGGRLSKRHGRNETTNQQSNGVGEREGNQQRIGADS